MRDQVRLLIGGFYVGLTESQNAGKNASFESVITEKSSSITLGPSSECFFDGELWV